MPPRPSSSRLRRTFACLLLVAFGLTQTLGMIHRVHAGHGVPKPGSPAQAAPAAGVAQVFDALFAGHHGDRDCSQFDQLANADLAHAKSPIAATRVAAPDIPAWQEACPAALRAAAARARGPPTIA